MAIPTELVGSLPRPMKLQEAYEAYDQGQIEWSQLQAEQDAAAADSIRRLEEVGEPIVTDGEQRESSFATYPITDTLAGTGLADNLAGDGQFFAIFDDGHHRQLPRLTGGPFRYKTFASEFVEKNKAIASGPVKQAVIAPSMLMLLYPLEGELEGYSREQFLDDLCDEVEKDIRQAFDAGAVRVSIDFTEGRLANKNDSRNPWTNKDMLQEFIDLNNRVIDRFSAEERVNIGIHTCPGGDCDSVHSKEVPYEKLLSKMFQLNAGYFLIQCASEDDRESVYKMCGEYSREDANGVAQVCFMGVINPLNPEVESAEHVRDELLLAAKYIPVERLGATDDCGFSPFSRDVKPKHGSPDFARDIAMQKIAARLEGAALARRGTRRQRRVTADGPAGRVSRARPFPDSGLDRGPAGRHDPPLGAEAVAALAVGLARGAVALEVVERVPGVGHAERAVGALGGPEQRGIDTVAARGRLTGRGQRRPGGGAGTVAGALLALVGLPQVQRATRGVDEHRAQVALGGTHGRPLGGPGFGLRCGLAGRRRAVAGLGRGRVALGRRRGGVVLGAAASGHDERGGDGGEGGCGSQLHARRDAARGEFHPAPRGDRANGRAGARRSRLPASAR